MSDDLADPAARRRIAENMHAEAMRSLSVTRNNEVEITSDRQVRIVADAARNILSMRLDDRALDAAAEELLERATVAGRWTWVNQPAAAGLGFVALLLGVGAAVLGATGDNIVLTVLGGLVGSALLGVVVLRYRRENWRIRAEQIAPMIYRPGV